MNPLRTVADLGQSIWLDYIRRDLLLTGGLHRLVVEDGLGGVTSNPAIFEKAIAGSPLYADAVRALLDQGDADANALFDAIAVRDVQDACDVLRPVYEKTDGADGFVSIEVSPYLAHDGRATLEEARRLKRLVGRPNLLVKIPATPEGIPAIRDALSEGISINITLLFARDAYEKVARAYIDGLEAYAAKGGDVSRVASVASFFISRIDTLADGLIQKKIAAGGPGGAPAGGADKARLEGLLGKVAIANGRLTYHLYKEIFSGPRWEALAKKGARTQRVLWASTSTKNPAYRDVVYVEELIGKDTVNTLPPQTLDAMRDHGKPRLSLEEDLEGAKKTLADLEAAGLSLKAITDQVLVEGVKLFADAFDTLLGAVEKKRREILKAPPAPSTFRLPAASDAAVKKTLDEARTSGLPRRLWAKDASLWKGGAAGRWLGWLEMPERLRRDPSRLDDVGRIAKEGGFTHALLLGMGGSSLAPDVLARTFPKTPGFPTLVVLDSTDTAQIAAAFAKLDLKRTLVIVASKSGSTLEPNILRDFALDKMKAAVGAEAPRRFIAITDPGSALEKASVEAGFLRVIPGEPTIGGRYSALSPFGLVPAAAMGLDVRRLLDCALVMARSCGAAVPPAENPGVLLGIVLGTLAKEGRDKLTLVVSPGIGGLGAWLEQLIAESTGKEGRGIIPIDGEAIAAPSEYGADRQFAYIRLSSAPDAAQDRAVDALAEAGHPVVRIDVAGPEDLTGEFFRWEGATAVAGAVLGIDPFDQPDVEASKVATRALTDAFDREGRLPAETPFAEADGLKFFADAANAKAIQAAAGGALGSGARADATAILAAHLGRLQPGDYAALLAYVEMSAAHEKTLQSIRHRVRAARRVATCLGFGPRYLHSTGQAYKGGPPSGVFIQVTCDEAADLPIPGRKATFGVVKAAQARGDFQVLAERGRRALRVHLGADVGAGLAALGRAVEAALARDAAVGGRRNA
ncbi:MAG TPA: bifunctional transaldolase/phosoglucose isomerase [Candidatus Polarisedimenticolia bacterium]|nr:bifunctional transaldolase/phosoglucose isomerase [Candidatus Polarisedimenticolia bacterium]